MKRGEHGKITAGNTKEKEKAGLIVMKTNLK